MDLFNRLVVEQIHCSIYSGIFELICCIFIDKKNIKYYKHFLEDCMNTIISKGLFVIIFSGLFFIVGCSSVTSISYSFVEDEKNSASISFQAGNPGASFLFYKGKSLPDAEEKTIWDPIVFPSGEPLEITVHVYHYETSSGIGDSSIVGLLAGAIADEATYEARQSRVVDTDVLFTCPPLQAGKHYSLSYAKGPALRRNRLVLVEIPVNIMVYQQDFGILAYPEPEINKPFAYVIDTFKVDVLVADNVALHNNSTDSNIGFNIYVHDPETNEWITFGAGSLEGAGDMKTIDSDISDITYYRYYAIEPLNGKNYKYEFYKRRDDLNINILDY